MRKLVMMMKMIGPPIPPVRVLVLFWSTVVFVVVGGGDVVGMAAGENGRPGLVLSSARSGSSSSSE